MAEGPTRGKSADRSEQNKGSRKGPCYAVVVVHVTEVEGVGGRTGSEGRPEDDRKKENGGKDRRGGTPPSAFVL